VTGTKIILRKIQIVCIISTIFIKAMKEKSKYGIPQSEPENGASLAGSHTERSSGASS
jgi:hypothetical protein